MQNRLVSLGSLLTLAMVLQNFYVAEVFASVFEIHPVPKVLELKSSSQVVLDESWVIVANLDNKQTRFNANYLKHHLYTEFALQLSLVSQTDKRADRTKRIILAENNLSKEITQFIKKNSISVPDTLGQEGYLLESITKGRNRDILILAGTAQGVFYGIQSMLHHPTGQQQLLTSSEGNITSEHVRIEDWPDRPVRGLFGLMSRDDSLFGDVNDLADAFEWVDALAKLKMNTITVGRWLDQLSDLDELYAYARLRYIEPVPFLGGLAGGSWEFAEVDPRLAEGFNASGELFNCQWDGSNYVAQPVIPVDQTDRIVNAGFEQGLNTGWTFNNPELLSTDSTTMEEGLVSFLYNKPALESASGVTRVILDRGNLIPISPGEIIDVSLRVKADNLEGDRPKVIVRQLTETFTETPGTGTAKTTTRLHGSSYEWRSYQQPVLASGDTRYLEVELSIGSNTTGKLWIDNIELKRLNSALVNVIRTETTDIELRNPETGTLFSEDSDYFVEDGYFRFLTNVDERRVRFFTGGEPFKVICNESGNIDLTKAFLMDYDFNAQMVHGQFKSPILSANEPMIYEKHIKPHMREIVEILKPSSVLYSGASEVSGLNRDSRSRGYENYQLLQSDINTVYSFLKVLDPSLKIYLWDDMLNPWHNGGNYSHSSIWGGGKFGAFEPRDFSLPRTTDGIPREDLIIWSWWYSADTNSKIANTPSYFSDKGFSWVGSPFRGDANVDDWAKNMSGNAANLGLMLWSPFYNKPGNIEYASERAWNLVPGATTVIMPGRLK